ncbi:hypothetical protein GF319_08225 [Candidatus Bathyarchaeota archaeon]|nr:hypothetical protein [Candidatus Bathyarchaeota archaeon]
MIDMRVEETLDPEDWDEFRALGHHMLPSFVILLILRTCKRLKYLAESPGN